MFEVGKNKFRVIIGRIKKRACKYMRQCQQSFTCQSLWSEPLIVFLKPFLLNFFLFLNSMALAVKLLQRKLVLEHFQLRQQLEEEDISGDTCSWLSTSKELERILNFLCLSHHILGLFQDIAVKLKVFFYYICSVFKQEAKSTS